MSLLAPIALLSAGAIAYEILLMRLFAIAQWHHYASMVISLALLGYGASGTAIALARQPLLRRFPAVGAGAAAVFAAAAPACFAIGQQLPFNPLELPWDPWQPVYLAGLYLLLSLPFFAAALCIGLAFARPGSPVGAIYAADLGGAGLGAVGLLASLFLLPPAACLALISAVGLLAAALFLPPTGLLRPAALAAALAVGALALLAPPAALTPRMSPYKSLSQTLQLPLARVVAQRQGPLGRVDVVRSPKVPLRHAPGLSLRATAAVPAQLGIFTDGEGMTTINRSDHRLGGLDFLDQSLGALPYALLAQPRVLILGAGGGGSVQLALRHRARRIDAVELNPRLAALVVQDFAAFAGRPFDRRGVFLHIGEARSYADAAMKRYDLIQLGLIDAGPGLAGGLQAISGSALYTREALETYLSRLDSGGVLAISCWLRLPPRDSLKLLATAADALRRRGIVQPGDHLALLRSWDTATLLATPTPLQSTDLAAIRRFARQHGFDLAWLPGLGRDEANRYNQLASPLLFDAATALLGPERARFMAGYKYELRPATDDRPFFSHFFTWRLLPELIAMQRAGSAALTEWGYVGLLAALAQAALLSLLLIALPLLALRRPAGPPQPVGRLRVLVYFAALGLAFLFLEIAWLHRVTLLMGHPVYAAAVVLAGFLVFAGLGSAWVQHRGPAHDAGRATVGRTVLVIAALTALQAALAPQLTSWLAAAPATIKVLAALAGIAPLAFCMGLPFPLGLRRLAATRPELVPWAWAINGCASVLSALLATLLAIHVGFTAVIGLAVACYLVAAWAYAGLAGPAAAARLSGEHAA